MDLAAGKNKAKFAKESRVAHFCWVPLSFLAVDLFAFTFLIGFQDGFQLQKLWPLAFGLLWTALFSCIVRLLPHKAGRIAYGMLFYLSVIYAGAQTGYYFLFDEMMWLSDFRYASEGADYASVVFSFPIGWWIALLTLIIGAVLLIWKFPRWKTVPLSSGILALTAAGCLTGAILMPRLVFLRDSEIRFAASDYGRSQSAEAAYKNMFNAHRLYEICGLNQTAFKDIYKNVIYPLTPGHAAEQARGRDLIDSYFQKKGDHQPNSMTGIFEGKNVVLILMESMDDWLIGEHTPTISRLMEEGINFTNFYTPVYGGIRTFNTEFCTNTGNYLSSQGGYAFDYVTNDFDFSFANLMRDQGYSAKTFHYNDPAFYSRGVFSPAMGYDEYVYYGDYVEGDDLYDDKILFTNQDINNVFFREADNRLNFIITRSAHLSYKYNEVLSYWGLKQYPEYRGLTNYEEEDCAYLKARLVDDMYAQLLQELRRRGELENTVIIGITDHYTYGIKDEKLLYTRSGVDHPMLLEKTPCFIWSADLEPMEITKTVNTADMLPTMLNLFGVESPVNYLGSDIFDSGYKGYVPFSDGSWICDDIAYYAQTDQVLYLGEKREVPQKELDAMAKLVGDFAEINNLILETDYYAGK